MFVSKIIKVIDKTHLLLPLLMEGPWFLPIVSSSSPHKSLLSWSPPFQASKGSSSLPLPQVSLSFPPAVSGFFLCWQLEEACCFQGLLGLCWDHPADPTAAPVLLQVQQMTVKGRSLHAQISEHRLGAGSTAPATPFPICPHTTPCGTQDRDGSSIWKQSWLFQEKMAANPGEGLGCSSLTSALRACFIICTSCNR